MIGILLLLVAVPALFAQEDGAQAFPPNSITGIAASSNQFTTLAAALEAAQLQDTLATGQWTVFAPTDAAFAQLGLNEGNIKSAYGEDALRDLLLYHTLAGRLATADLKGMLGDVTMANGQLAGLKFYEDHIYVNDNAKVTSPNILASNGYIHVVDSVIERPWPREATVETDTVSPREQRLEAQRAQAAAELAELSIPLNGVAGQAYANPRLDTFGAAVVAAGLADQLSTGSWTAFIPTDGAFARLGMNPKNIADQFTQEELANLVMYHMLPANYSTENLKTMLGDVIMANGQQAGLKYFRRRIWVNDESRVVGPDIAADNGTIHIVNQVVLPPWPRVEEQDASDDVPGLGER
jgi:uncharacterized surface protein with fasciclin (FAS1) repeats